MPCRFAQPAEEAERIDAVTDARSPIQGPMLCGWAQDEAPAEVLGLPRWLQRSALAGDHLRYPEDCKGCPVRKET